MLKYPCLVLDHDDTVVQSEATVNYPCFCQTLAQIRPGVTITQEEYAQGCSELGFVDMCKQWYAFTKQELDNEYIFWKHYSKSHIPTAVPGMSEILLHHKQARGNIFVVSHSSEETILRDYKAHFSVLPDRIYGCDAPVEKQKPSSFPIQDIMDKFGYKPEEILVVDDMKPAWEMARSAGVKIAFAGWSRKNFPGIYQEMRSLCDYTFDSVSELQNFLF